MDVRPEKRRESQRQLVNVRYENSQQLYTYHFDSEGCMDTGWYQDTEGQWYYLVPDPGSEQGRLKIGWYFDQDAGNGTI